jgi:methionyl-tRNA synthetase
MLGACWACHRPECQDVRAMPARKLFVTTALPYANGNFHIGHIMEYIQADIWVRTQRMLGNEVNFVGADDTHGAPIMIAAEKAGKTPQQFVADIAAGRQQYLDGFHISSTTGTAPTRPRTTSWRSRSTWTSRPTA